MSGLVPSQTPKMKTDSFTRFFLLCCNYRFQFGYIVICTTYLGLKLLKVERKLDSDTSFSSIQSSAVGTVITVIFVWRSNVLRYLRIAKARSFRESIDVILPSSGFWVRRQSFIALDRDGVQLDKRVVAWRYTDGRKDSRCYVNGTPEDATHCTSIRLL